MVLETLQNLNQPTFRRSVLPLIRVSNRRVSESRVSESRFSESSFSESSFSERRFSESSFSDGRFSESKCDYMQEPWFNNILKYMVGWIRFFWSCMFLLGG